MRRLPLVLLLATALFVVTDARTARAQAAPPTAPSQLPVKTALYNWDQDNLKLGVHFEEVIDRAMEDKLSNGPSVTILVRVLVFRDGEPTPVRLVLQTCVVSYDLWENVYSVDLRTTSGTEHRAVANAAGVKRMCAQTQDLPIAARSSLRV